MSTHAKFSLRILALATSAVLLMSSAAHAQVVGGTITGIVSDPSGAIIQHASVVVRNEETGTHRNLVTGDDGRFAAISIPAGRYTVNAQAPGFANYKLIDLPLSLGQSLSLHIALEITGSETVDVSSQPLGVNLSTEETSGVVDAREVKDLPLNGRSYDQLLTLNPGQRQLLRSALRFGRHVQLLGRQHVFNLRPAAAGQSLPPERHRVHRRLAD